MSRHRDVAHDRVGPLHPAQRLEEQTVIIGLVILISLGAATLLAARLQKFISDPIVALSRTASEVSLRGDYSLRAQRRTDDELGMLVDADPVRHSRTRAEDAAHDPVEPQRAQRLSL